MNLNPKYLIKILETHGYSFKRSKGSHRLYYNSVTNKTIIVPFHAGKNIKKVNSLQYCIHPTKCILTN